ncbi:hypothetical protein N431DRAFT_546864 [Stipitochalara longipes BDJ]|nr:hypothetical protein N431DRAFT_546864 [Stipitochalara longipes BDJ]
MRGNDVTSANHPSQQMEPTISSSLPKLALAVRLATLDDVPAITTLISTSKLKGSLASVYGVDTTLVKDGDYFVVTMPLLRPNGRDQKDLTLEVSKAREHDTERRIIACGGWSFRSTLYGGDQFSSRNDDNLMNLETDAAKIRALFVHPDFTRMGIGGLILDKCENEARKRGFKRAEMGATFAGVKFYRTRGYELLMDQGTDGVEERKLENGEVLKLVRMGRLLVQ